ncbi:coagulation factor X-like [Pelmatolapia mariae]|uniref:coagulation factor X-like n=1 Tax=Pelmatolapia mariae TaxID=158779 RepID=UPI002FE6A0D7
MTGDRTGQVFRSAPEANTMFLRPKRANTFMEEFRQGNLERECYEEQCNIEEAREYFEDTQKTKTFWAVYSVLPQLCKNKNGGCEHFCNVIQGSVQCSCADGYFLASDKKSCHFNETIRCGFILPKALQTVLRDHQTKTTEGNITALNSSVNSTEPIQDADLMSDLVSENRTQIPAETWTTLESLIDSEIEDESHRQSGYCPPGECPWQALLFNENETVYCGGTILNENIILTAASCVNQSDDFNVRLGEFDRSVNEGTEVDHKVEAVLAHRNYNPQTHDNDIALIKLATPIKFTRFILPVCIPEQDFAKKVLMREPVAVVSGFGRLGEAQIPSMIMKRLVVTYVDRQTCIESTRYLVTDRMFCAGYKYRDACQGDGGGPHITRYNDTHFITGIVSWGEGCGRKGKYSFYTRVSKYIRWIHEGIKKLVHSGTNGGSQHPAIKRLYL